MVIKKLAKKVPDNAEVVVDYRFSLGGSGRESNDNRTIAASGTALIPKKKEEKILNQQD